MIASFYCLAGSSNPLHTHKKGRWQHRPFFDTFLNGDTPQPPRFARRLAPLGESLKEYVKLPKRILRQAQKANDVFNLV